jgi:hypothetical protein
MLRLFRFGLAWYPARNPCLDTQNQPAISEVANGSR